MKLSYTDLTGQTHEVEAEITTDHSASSYGQPVIVLPDGGPVDMASWVLLNYSIVETQADEQELAEKFIANLDRNLELSIS